MDVYLKKHSKIYHIKEYYKNKLDKQLRINKKLKNKFGRLM